MVLQTRGGRCGDPREHEARGYNRPPGRPEWRGLLWATIPDCRLVSLGLWPGDRLYYSASAGAMAHAREGVLAAAWAGDGRLLVGRLAAGPALVDGGGEPLCSCGEPLILAGVVFAVRRAHGYRAGPAGVN